MNDFSNEPAEGATFSMMAHTSHYERVSNFVTCIYKTDDVN